METNDNLKEQEKTRKQRAPRFLHGGAKIFQTAIFGIKEQPNRTKATGQAREVKIYNHDSKKSNNSASSGINESPQVNSSKSDLQPSHDESTQSCSTSTRTISVASNLDQGKSENRKTTNSIHRCSQVTTTNNFLPSSCDESDSGVSTRSHSTLSSETIPTTTNLDRRKFETRKVDPINQIRKYLQPGENSKNKVSDTSFTSKNKTSIRTDTGLLGNKEIEIINKSSKWPQEQITVITKVLLEIEKQRACNVDLAVKFCEELNKVLGFMRGCNCRLYGSYKGDYAIESSDVNVELYSANSNSSSNCISNRFMQEVVKIIAREKPEYYVHFNSAPKLSDSFITVTENENGLDCEMKYLGFGDKYKTTLLIEGLIKMDRCVKTLIIALRHWAEICRIHETENGYLHPLCYVLMVIHFLQQCDPPVLPIVTLHKDKAENMCYNIPDKKTMTTNLSTIGELWLQLLEYYDSFNWRDHIICITSHRLLGKDGFSSSCWIGIAAPIDPSQNIAKSVTDPDASHLIQSCFSRTFNYFSKPTNNVRQSSEEGGDSSMCDEGFSEPEYDYLFEEIHFTESVEMASLCLRCKEFLCICDNSDEEDDESMSSSPSSQEISDDLIANIDTALTELYHEHILDQDEIKERERVVADIEKYIQYRFPNAKLKIMGSTKNGFGFKKSDLDICLTFDTKMINDINAITTLKILRAHLRRNHKFANVLAIFGAKIPLIQFVWRESGLRGDISLYNLLAVRNTELLHTYSCVDIRCRILGCAMKLLAKHAGLANAAEKSLSSYSYILLVIYFLQKTNPPVLPVLQELSVMGKYENIIENWDTYFFDELENLDLVWDSFHKNKQSVGELWVNLLEFYTRNFDFNTVITIHTSDYKTVDDLRIRTARLFNILDPFMLTKNLGSLMSETMTDRTNRTFHRAYKLLYNNQVPKGFKDFKEYLFDPMNLTEGRLSKLTECDICGKLGHSSSNCPRNNFLLRRGLGRYSYNNNTRTNNYRTKTSFNNFNNGHFTER